MRCYATRKISRSPLSFRSWWYLLLVPLTFLTLIEVIGRPFTFWFYLIRALHESGYRGAYTLEIFSDEVPNSLWEGDLSKVINDSRIGLERAWREVAGNRWE